MNPIAARLAPFALRLGVIALIALAVVAGWHYVKSLRTELADAQSDARSAKEALGRRDAAIIELQRKARDDAKALAQLERQRQRIVASLARSESDFEALKHENETLRAWADSPLPDDVIRLYERPAVIGADEYDAAMRARHALHASRDSTAD
ncbi:Rz-like lysis system protein LysB [Trinickia sp. LjRoot230]|uniref:Rz-like lysis system protein LysB n=1 Tax=Trinickia sp. LjRoot230 TaxID=3342288 RepID=UPI003ECCE4BE